MLITVTVHYNSLKPKHTLLLVVPKFIMYLDNIIQQAIVMLSRTKSACAHACLFSSLYTITLSSSSLVVSQDWIEQETIKRLMLFLNAFEAFPSCEPPQIPHPLVMATRGSSLAMNALEADKCKRMRNRLVALFIISDAHTRELSSESRTVA